MGAFLSIYTLSLFLVMMLICINGESTNQKTFNVLRYGAVGDGRRDDSEAFSNVWRDSCNAVTDKATIIIPGGKTFLVQPIVFTGPCKPKQINILLSGVIVAPLGPSSWKGKDVEKWIVFKKVSGLNLDGSGSFDGRGKSWWDHKCRYHPGKGCIVVAPTVLYIESCNDVKVSRISIKDSPQGQIAVLGGVNFDFGFLKIHTPGYTLNTDGIHLQSCSYVNIHNTDISSGDDCISIGDYTSFINVTNVNCGPGHGVSIGSLGLGGGKANVHNITVQHVNFFGTTNGVRIKTYKVGRGEVKNVVFSNLNFTNVENPIIIDQYYGLKPNRFPRMELLIMFMLLSMAFSGLSTETINSVSVMEYGAVGDGNTDDSPAFLKAWEEVCKSESTNSSLTIPGKNFLLKPVTFNGPCKSSYINVQLSGNLVAPKSKSDYKGYHLDTWLSFSNINGLVITGDGTIDGQGSVWWPNPCFGAAPKAMKFNRCYGLVLSGLRHVNSARNHITITKCDNATISKLHITAPGTSPNTDGIDIASSTGVQVHDSVIGTGDDCIAISGGSSMINITGVFCGPGHGISIGALGVHGESDIVEEVHVRNCTFEGTLTGVRIKTWQGGSGYARKIYFEEIQLNAANSPIIIDQFYCPGGGGCQNKASAVKVSDVSYKEIKGTSMTDKAINLSCDDNVSCTNIVLDHVHITAADPKKKVSSSCNNAHGRSSNTIPVVDCLLQ
ncbi:Pectin lyase-like superfamily protein [Quillaja saponaria]|uniref:Pectin lyase-like superfamily protein n=1 Tax=Quillaja saponaria TaxID=32244 RepID=A0AAD7LR96_QUISA|nr:Pectin lyase-like superfamily protein [Quillaja saponaria]